MTIKLIYNGIEHIANVVAPTGAARDAFNSASQRIVAVYDSLKKSLESAEFDLLWDTPNAKARAKYAEDSVEMYKNQYPQNAFNKHIISTVREEAVSQYNMKLRATDIDGYDALRKYDAKIQELLREALNLNTEQQKELELEMYKIVFKCTTLGDDVLNDTDFWYAQDVTKLKEGIQFFRNSIGIR